jgi:uncharacterized protein YbjT (DUF2867 family)
MRIAVIGAAGTAGRHTLEALRRAGHDAVPVTRSLGVDVLTGAGLEQALAGAAAVIDATNVQTSEGDETRARFAAATRNILDAERRAGVAHHVLLSIVGTDRVERNEHFAGKRIQEEIVSAGPVPFTIQRATQFYELVEVILGWTLNGDVAHLPPVVLQPLAAADAGGLLAEVAAGPPRGHAVDIAGPERHDLVELARRVIAARGRPIHVVPTWIDEILGAESSRDALLPGPGATLAPTRFEEWLTAATR